MSMLLMVKAFGCKVGNPARKLVLLKLADNANDDGECFPSYQYIADNCEISKRSAIVHINQLEKDGFLTITHRYSKGNSRSNIYTLFPAKNIPIKPVDNSATPSAESAPPLVQNLHHPSAEFALPPSAESAPITYHSFNQSLNHTEISRARGAALIREDFVIDEQVKFRLQAAGVKLEVAEFFVVEFVNQNISSGWSSFDWAAHLVSYCKKNEWRYTKHEESKRVSQSGQLTGAAAQKAAVFERIKNL